MSNKKTRGFGKVIGGIIGVVAAGNILYAAGVGDAAETASDMTSGTEIQNITETKLQETEDLQKEMETDAAETDVESVTEMYVETAELSDWESDAVSGNAKSDDYYITDGELSSGDPEYDYKMGCAYGDWESVYRYGVADEKYQITAKVELAQLPSGYIVSDEANCLWEILDSREIKDQNFMEGDIITVYGEFVMNDTVIYTNGTTEPVPCLRAKYMELYTAPEPVYLGKEMIVCVPDEESSRNNGFYTYVYAEPDEASEPIFIAYDAGHVIMTDEQNGYAYVTGTDGSGQYGWMKLEYLEYSHEVYDYSNQFSQY